MINKTLFLTYVYLFIYILLSSGVILYNKVPTTTLSLKEFFFFLSVEIEVVFYYHSHIVFNA